MKLSTSRFLIRLTGALWVVYCSLGLLVFIFGYALWGAAFGAPPPTYWDQFLLGLECALIVTALIGGVGILLVRERGRLVVMGASVLFTACYSLLVVLPRLRAMLQSPVELVFLVLVPLLYVALLAIPPVAMIFRSTDRIIEKLLVGE